MSAADNRTESFDKDISLLLSGGGFRATLFHLGVVRYLREHKLLKSVKQIFSVSGGSILAAHLAQKWTDYVGEEDQFDRVATELVAFIRRGIRESIIRMRILFWCICCLLFSVIGTALWLLAGFPSGVPGWVWLIAGPSSVVIGYFFIERFFRPVHILEKSYHRLFGKFRVGDISNDAPEFYSLGTNLTTGNPCCFTKKGIIVDLPLDEDELPEPVAIHVSMASAVTASSAFPPLFSPWIFNPRRYNLDKKRFTVSNFITDGGVFDNLGLAAATRLTPHQNQVLVSDSERRFDWATNQSFRLITSRTSRAFEIAMRRLSTICHSGLGQGAKLTGNAMNHAFLRLQDDPVYSSEVDSLKYWKETFTHTRQIRTDLDSFSDVEIQCLFAAGYLAASQWHLGEARLSKGMRINENGFPVLSNPDETWLPVKNSQPFESVSAESQLSGSVASKAKLVNLKSWTFWAMVLTGIAAILLNPLSLSMIRSIPVDVQSLADRDLEVDTLPLMESDPKLRAIEPGPVDVIDDPAFKQKHNLLLRLPLDSANRFFARTRMFRFRVECSKKRHSVEYVRAMIVDSSNQYFTYCLPEMQPDGATNYVCPPTHGGHTLYVYVVISTNENQKPLTNTDVSLSIVRSQSSQP